MTNTITLSAPERNMLATGRRNMHSMLFSWLSTVGGAAGIVSLLLSAFPISGQVVLNEVMALNRAAVAHGGVYPDYLELYNKGEVAIDVGGMSVDDGGNPPSKVYVLPNGTKVQPKSFLVVWCSTNQTVTGIRAPFGLGSDGETIRLRNGSGAILDEIKYGIQAADYSIGRMPDGGTWILNQPTPQENNVVQELGSATNLCFNEWMADPVSGTDDWLELFNTARLPVSLSGLYITDSRTATFTNRAIRSLSFIAHRGFTLFLADDLGGGDKLSPEHLDFKLSKSGERLTLYASNRITVLNQVTFGIQEAQRSEGRVPDGGQQIIRFPTDTSTPGAPNHANIKGILISEVLTHTDPPLEDSIELHNPGAQAVNIGYWWLSDSGNQPKKYQIPANTIIPAGGYKVFYEYQFGAPERGDYAFQLDSAEGDTVYLTAGNADGTLSGEQTMVEFGALLNGISVGYHRTSLSVDYPPLSRRTFGVDNPINLTHFRSGAGLSNALPRVGPIVISEIMYSPTNGMEEYIELLNISQSPALLYHRDYPTNTWRLRKGVQFNFPQSQQLPAGATALVVGFDPVLEPARLQSFRSVYKVPSGTLILGPYEGKLSDVGEDLELLEPDKPEPPGDPRAGFVPYCLVELVKFSASGLWPNDANDTGKSLQRFHSDQYANEPTNWVAALPSAGKQTSVQRDADADGIPDDWETAYGLNPNSEADATADLDNDGMTNRDEYLANTHPGDPASALRISISVNSGSQLNLRFMASPHRSYTVEYRDHLLLGSWQPLTNITTLDEAIQGSVSAPSSAAAQRSYRVTVQSDGE